MRTAVCPLGARESSCVKAIQLFTVECCCVYCSILNSLKVISCPFEIPPVIHHDLLSETILFDDDSYCSICWMREEEIQFRGAAPWFLVWWAQPEHCHVAEAWHAFDWSRLLDNDEPRERCKRRDPIDYCRVLLCSLHHLEQAQSFLQVDCRLPCQSIEEADYMECDDVWKSLLICMTFKDWKFNLNDGEVNEGITFDLNWYAL